MSGATVAVLSATEVRTPGALSWTNINDSGHGGGQTNTQTITAITVSINLRLSWNAGTLNPPMTYKRNGGAATAITNNTTDIAVSAGDTLQFLATSPPFGGPVTMSVLNHSVSDAVLATFTVTLS